jgi:broad specificity phosphatase PhoE
VIHLIRHGHAGSRGLWSGDDLDRPLSDRGRQQAASLARLLAEAPVTRVWSSPARRCTETVGPLAVAHRTEVAVHPVLAEGGDSYEVLAFLLAEAAATEGDVVACGHGDVIPNLIGSLAAEGLPIEGSRDPGVTKKGALWHLEVTNGVVTGARYRPPET